MRKEIEGKLVKHGIEFASRDRGSEPKQLPTPRVPTKQERWIDRRQMRRIRRDGKK